MIRSYTCENYRAFRNAHIEIRPLTIFLGANGIGKTSLMQIPLLLQQTAEVDSSSYHAPLKIHGRSVSFGDASNIVFKRDSKKNLSFSIDFESGEIAKLLSGRLSSDFADKVYEIGRYFKIYVLERSQRGENIANDSELIEKAQNLFSSLSLRNQSIVQTIELLESLQAADPSAFSSAEFANYQQRRMPIRPRRIRRARITSLSPARLRETSNWINALPRLDEKAFTVRYEFDLVGKKRDEKKLRICRFTLSNKGLQIFDYKNNKEPIINFVGKEYLPEDHAREIISDLISSIDFDAPIFDTIKLGSGKEDISEFLLQLISSVQNELVSEFADEGVNHVTPLRAFPKRYYFLDPASVGGPQGDSLIELLRENSALRQSVNSWLERLKISVDVEQFREIVHSLRVRKGNLEFDLDITDVGFGISQVLPVIVQSFMAEPDSITIIEQPEIHLHPNMQGDLAELFIDAINDADLRGAQRRFLIETHSEYLLNRLRRKVAEGAIDAEKVAIYFVERSPDDPAAAQVRMADMKSSGAFNWPLEFYEKSLEDTVEFLKLQG